MQEDSLAVKASSNINFSEWKGYLKNRKFIIEFTSSLILLVLVLFIYSRFLLFVEDRAGTVLPDLVLNILPLYDLTWLTFSLIYFSLAAVLIYLINKPKVLLFSLQAYTLLIVVRIAAMFTMPLNPPEDMIPLHDPLVEFFGTGKLLTKDLFFSGHTASIFLFFLIAENKILKWFFLISSILVAAFLLLQHVHYTVDILAAPFFTYAVFVLISRKNFD